MGVCKSLIVLLWASCTGAQSTLDSGDNVPSIDSFRQPNPRPSELRKELEVTLPKVFLDSVPTTVEVTLPGLEDYATPWPESVKLSVYR